MTRTFVVAASYKSVCPALSRTKKGRCEHRPVPIGAAAEAASASLQLRWLLISFVISNIETWAFLKISFSLASALIIVRFAES